jgi:thiamine biosynthesis lipoprotein ApbE
VFLFNTLGYTIAFEVLHWQVKKAIKKEIKNKLKDEELIQLTFKKSELDKIEFEDGGKEIVFNDNMYDIVKQSETQDEITYYCINDSKEKELFTNLDDHINTHIKANKPIKNNGAKKLSDNVVKIYFLNRTSFSFFDQSSTFERFNPINLYSSYIKSASIPPPEVC